MSAIVSGATRGFQADRKDRVANDFVNDVLETPDGGLLLAGSSKNLGHGREDGCLIKTNALGQKEWVKAYGGSENDVFMDISWAFGSWLLSGYTGASPTGQSTGWLVKIDGAGTQEWAKTYSDGGMDVINSAEQGGYGGIILAGEAASGITPENGPVGDAWLLITNTAGDLE